MKILSLFVFFIPQVLLAKPTTDLSFLQSQKLLQQGLKDEVGYQLIESLTTEVGPRLGGSEAEARARKWAIRKMKSLGFKNVREEKFPIRLWQRVKETAQVLPPYSQNLRITALGQSLSTPKEGVEAFVVRFPTIAALKKAPLKGYQNKILFVDQSMSRSRDGRGYGEAVEMRYQTGIEAAKRGAAAALIRSVGTDHHRFPHTGQMDVKKHKTVPVAALSAPDADQLGRLMKKDAIRLRLNIQTKITEGMESGNVIGEIPGHSDEIVLLGAHLDSWDLGTGAVDDGAGVGIVMAAAKKIMGLKFKPQRTIRVVLFGAEEVGLLGAKDYASRHKDEVQKHFVASESDFGAGKIWRVDSRFSNNDQVVRQHLAKVLESLNIPSGTNNAYGGPDLIPLLKQGVPVFGLKQNGTDYFDLHHTEDDTFDKIKKEDVQQNVAAWASTIWALCQWQGKLKAPPLSQK